MEEGKLRLEFESTERIRQHELALLEKETEKIRAETELEVARVELERCKIQCEHELRMAELRIKESTAEESFERVRKQVGNEEKKAALERMEELQQRIAALKTENLMYQESASVNLRNLFLLASTIAVVSAAASEGLGAVASGMGAAAAAVIFGSAAIATPIAGAVAVAAGVGYAYKLIMSKR